MACYFYFHKISNFYLLLVKSSNKLYEPTSLKILNLHRKCKNWKIKNIRRELISKSRVWCSYLCKICPQGPYLKFSAWKMFFSKIQNWNCKYNQIVIKTKVLVRFDWNLTWSPAGICSWWYQKHRTQRTKLDSIFFRQTPVALNFKKLFVTMIFSPRGVYPCHNASKVSAKNPSLYPLNWSPSINFEWACQGASMVGMGGPKNVGQKNCSPLLPFFDHLKHVSKHIISIHRLVRYWKLVMTSHWAMIWLYWRYGTNSGVVNDDNTTIMNVVN